MKKVLLVGGGAREHAIAWKLKQSPRLGRLFVAPGNAGTAQIADNISLKATDIDGLLAFALKQSIDLTIVGPDDPLALGIVDAFQAKGLKIFGPTKAAAQIESSKVFSKQLMRECRVPTAAYVVFSKHQEAVAYVQSHFAFQTRPVVVKASGLALGKGVYICRTLAEAEQALDEIMIKRVHRSAGDQVVIEDFLDGQEVSMHLFCDGRSFRFCPAAQDHKQLLDGDKGPNTGGMGTIAPVPWFKAEDVVGKDIVRPIIRGLWDRGMPFTGLLYPGLKMSEDGPKVLEFNARFGDPETQVYMRLLNSDLLDIFEACVENRLHMANMSWNIEWNPGFAVCIVLASAGYPSPDYKKGLPIIGIREAEELPGVVVFHAGTTSFGGIDDEVFTDGGRVLSVTAIGATLQGALVQAYKAVRCIYFQGMQYRKDIGAKCLQM